MLTTGCEECCFLKQDDKGKGCVLGQFCTVQDEQIFAPGYCRMCRSHKWVKKQNTTELKQLYTKVLEERSLKFDMLIFFDESKNSVEDLGRTLNADWYVKYVEKIIIMDTTGFGNRKNLALQYIQSRKHTVPIVVDSSVVHESPDQREETIRRVSKQVTSPFFLVIPAGSMPRDFDAFAKKIQHETNRVIHWSIPETMGFTMIVPNHLCYGLFITTPYKALIKSSITQSFAELLRIEEIEMDMGLSMFCPVCWLL